MSALESLREDVAHLTRRGIGMTLAASLYWLGLAAVTSWAGLQPDALAVFLLVATALVYPLGWWLNRWCGGDLLARGHPLSSLVLLLVGIQALGWPMLSVLFREDRALLPFALAAMLGAHFVAFGWLYRSRAYYVAGIGSVVLATLLQWWHPQQAPLLIPPMMALCYVFAAEAVRRELRRSQRVG